MSSIIPGAKHQELNMSFTFDQSQEDKLIIDALVDRTPYQIQIGSHLDIDFQDIKDALLSKQFKIVSRTPEILKLKIAVVSFEFKNIEKITLNTLKQTVAELKQTITELNKKINSQSQKNTLLEDLVKQLRKEFDSITTQLSDLRRANDENKEQMKRSESEWKERVEEEKMKRVELGKQLEEEKTKRQEWERTMKTEGQRTQNMLMERMKNMEAWRDQQRQNARLKQLEEKRVRQIESERLKIFEEEIMKQLQEERKRQKVEDKQVEQLQQRLKKLEAVQRLQEEERLKKEMEERKRIILILQEEEQRKLKLIQEQQLKLEQERQKEIEHQKQVSTQNAQYLFSSTHKHSMIQLENNNTKAIGSGYSGLALVEGVVFEKDSSIRFRISSIDQCVAVGLGIRNVIVKNGYQIPNWNKFGHGCFLLSHGGPSFSHSNKEHNNVKTDFKYSKGDVIVVSRSGDELCWRNESEKKEFRMKANLTADEWSDACFCVYLSYPSSVQILKRSPEQQIFTPIVDDYID